MEKSCHKNRMTSREITLWREYVTSFTTSVSTMRFLIETLSILKAIKSNSKGSYDKQNLTPVVISYEMTTRVRFSIYYLATALHEEHSESSDNDVALLWEHTSFLRYNAL